jgi:branched-chain amino acid transport system ATP-binding protein
VFRGHDITDMARHRICALGLVRTFQLVQPFMGLTVRENIAIGAHVRLARRREALMKAAEVAERVNLARQLDEPVGRLTVAGRKRLELARALATQPKLLLLDEVMAGLTPTEIEEVVEIIRGIRGLGVTVLLIEHVMQAVMRLSEHTWVLSDGRIIAEGRPAEIAAHPRVIEAYLGPGAARAWRRHDDGAGDDLASPRYEAVGRNGPVSSMSFRCDRRGEIVAVLAATALQVHADQRHTDLRRSGARSGSTTVLAGVGRVAAGLVQVPEGRRIFPNLTVRENLELGSYRRGKANRARNLERVTGLFPRLGERSGQSAGTLSGGEQQMLAIGRGLMSEPRLLILDEPSLGLSPLLVEEIFGLIRSMNRDGLTILLVEQNVMQSLSIAHRAYVIENGRLTLSGSAADLIENPEVKRSYLGL